ncbi:hypothetical protein QQS21_004238 [Conoideocrella luteorostrata]|uniref:FAD-binding PCMH-type domain-containing protein n=1 Tax=Conoideocrella luteorostrata TaxID=1105319 RepID=A0AAJ0CRQ0_9HYPO|nr:hypothetical protein QQS21_004238 [Conoideocrella luteorostrata]
MNAAFQNQSCDPYTPAERPCELGNHASYSINIAGVDDVLAGIKFAREKNIRLVIRNTGHDFMGKSTGKGSLSLWTHSLNKSEITTKYSSRHYTGPAVKVGAGVIAGFLYKTVADAGYRVVGGTCASVGMAGGYSAGGGHSLINGIYGMAADNMLEWELVTAEGNHVVATPDNEYSDLYWAMSGGGGGVWGVVISMTSRIHRDGAIGGASLKYNASGVDANVYWDAVKAWYAYLPFYTDGLHGGNTVEFEITAAGFSAISFTIPGASKAQVDVLLTPYLKQLQDLGIRYSYSSHTSPNYYVHYNTDLGPLPYGPWPGDILFSSRLFPRAVSENTTTNSALVDTIRNMTRYQDGYFWLGCMGLRVNSSTGHPDNAVLPAFRDVLGICTVIGYWNWTIPFSDMLERKAYLVDNIVPALEAVTPGSGSYLNEVDSWYKGDWKREFYGVNYDRLVRVKRQYDPDHFFYAYTGISSDDWHTDANGRLCRS